MTYSQLQDLIDNFNIRKLETEIGENLPPSFHDGSYHEIKAGNVMRQHSLDTFKVLIREYFPDNNSDGFPIPEANLEFIWRYCPQCKEVRNKSLIGYYSENNMASVREIISKGHIV